MSRPLRLEYANAHYHVMNRGRGRQGIFHGPAYYQAFLTCLEEAHQRFRLQILAYCLMGNHYHLLLKTPEGNLSRNMRHINGHYTQRYNRLKKTDGPLFRGRYKAILIDADSYLLQVSRYIHRNPIETKKPLVAKLEAYPWSSYRSYLNQATSPGWLAREEVLSMLNSQRRFQAYRNYVEQGIDETTHNFYGLKTLPGVWGDKTFVQQAYKKLDIQNNEISLSTFKARPSMEQVIEYVARRYQCPEENIRYTARGKGRKNRARWIAMYLCQELCGETLSRIADVFNVGHYSTVSQTIGRLKREIAEDKRLMKQVNMLSQDLTP